MIAGGFRPEFRHKYSCADPNQPGSTIAKGASTLNVFVTAYFVHTETFQLPFWVIFYILGSLLNNWSVLRMRPTLRFALLRVGRQKSSHAFYDRMREPSQHPRRPKSGL